MTGMYGHSAKVEQIRIIIADGKVLNAKESQGFCYSHILQS